MLIPDTIDLSPAQASAFDQLLPEFEENGFELGRLSRPYGRNRGGPGDAHAWRGSIAARRIARRD